MPYLYNTTEDQQEMLASIGAESIDELFEPIPAELKLNRSLEIPAALSEIELDIHLRDLASRNAAAGQKVCFLGGGIYDHFVPAAVDAIGSRSEFYTSYTPYQAEASQGNLQAMYEYQSLICRLTGMEVSNSSLYDGSSSVAEAVLMAVAATRRTGNVVVPSSLHPEYRETIATYLANLDVELTVVEADEGVVDAEQLREATGAETAAVVLQQPNFFGCVEDAASAAGVAHEAGALLISVFDPISLGILKCPGDYDANIAVAEGQTLGTPMSYGGPVLGIMACDQALIRRMPGRIVGETKDRRGNRCFVLTLQTREQHIRREKATSNVCTNQGLFALRAAAYLALAGPQGLRETAELCVQKANYLRDQLCEADRFSAAFAGPIFKEFVIRDAQGEVDQLIEQAAAAGYFAGIPLGRWYPELSDCLLICVTERRTKQEIDGLVAVLTGQANASAEELACGTQVVASE